MAEPQLPTLYCHQAVVDAICGLPRRPWEVGGWLLGYWNERTEVVITHATPPGLRGTPFGIHIDGRRHRPLFDQAWEASDGIVTFLGDWHTHPGGPALPSKRDSRALSYLASEPDFGTELPIAGIVALPRYPWSKRNPTMRFWLRGEDGVIRELRPTLVTTLPAVARSVPTWSWPSGQRRSSPVRQP